MDYGDPADARFIVTEIDGEHVLIVRIDRVDQTSGMLAYHFLNDELRVQEGIQEVPIEKFIAEGWYLDSGSAR